MNARRIQKLRNALEVLILKYQGDLALESDPLRIPLEYRDPWSRELAAWVSAHLAYGRVAPMLKAIHRVMAPLGAEPAEWLRQSSPSHIRKELGKALSGWVWRFHTSQDLAEWLLAWKGLDEESCGRGIERHLLPCPDQSPDEALSRLVQRLRLELPPSRGTRFSLPDPLEGAACKRWRMFLRWMVREGWPDLGQWKTYPSDALVIPLDTHVARTARFLGLSARSNPDGRMAQEVTAALRLLAPKDPLRYDFALAHLGILGDCPGVRQLPACGPCPLVDLCQAGVTKRKTPSATLP